MVLGPHEQVAQLTTLPKHLLPTAHVEFHQKPGLAGVFMRAQQQDSKRLGWGGLLHGQEVFQCCREQDRLGRHALLEPVLCQAGLRCVSALLAKSLVLACRHQLRICMAIVAFGSYWEGDR